MAASVVVVSYNSERYLQPCIDSILAQLAPDDELIVVDNGSADGSAALVREQYPHVRLICGDNVGYAGGNNRGAAEAQGDSLVFLNPDIVLAPGALRALLAPLEGNTAVALTTACIVHINRADVINTCGNTVHFTGLTYCRGAGQPRTQYATPAEVDAVSGAAFAIRRTVFELLGGFDERFFLYVEDTDLSWRARLAGYRCLYVPAAIVHHHYTLRFGPQKMFYQERNRYMLLLKGWQWRTLLALLPALLLAEAVTWGFVLLRERQQALSKTQAYLWVVKHWREIMQRRHQTQALRRVGDHALLAQCRHGLAYEQTGDGVLAHVAHAVFDPLFLVFQRLALAVIR